MLSNPNLSSALSSSLPSSRAASRAASPSSRSPSTPPYAPSSVASAGGVPAGDASAEVFSGAAAMTSVRLAHPLVFRGETIETLTLRRPRVRDLKRFLHVQARAQARSEARSEGRLATEAAGAESVDASIQLIADLCEREPQLIDELDGADYLALQELVADFLGLSPPSMHSVRSRSM